MRYMEIQLVEFRLLEYDRTKTAQRMGSKLLGAARGDQIFWNQIQDRAPDQQLDAVLEKLEEMDPTPKKKYVQWLAKQYVNKQFRLEDLPSVNRILSYFTERDVIRDFRRKGLSLDINQYTYSKLRAEIVDSAQGGIDQDQSQSNVDPNLDYENIKDIRVLYSGELGQLLIPKTKAASCEIGRDTAWCTAQAQDNQHDRYSKDGPLFVWIDADGSKYQFHFEGGEFMDEYDEPLDPDYLYHLRTEHPVLSKLFKAREKIMVRTGKGAAEYASAVIGDRWPEAEPAIAKGSRSAFLYAKYVIGGRWPEGEPAIAEDDLIARLYAKYVIKGR